MEKSQRAQGQEPDCMSSRDTCNSLFCIPVPSESRLLWVFHSYEQLSWLSTGGWQRIRSSTCWTPNIQATRTSVFALFVPFWFPVVASTTKSSPPHRRKDSQTQPLSLNSAKHCKIQKIIGVHYYGAAALLLMFTTCVVFSIYLLFIQLQSLIIALSPWNTSQMGSCAQEVTGVNFLWENLWPHCWIWEHQSQLVWGVHGKKETHQEKALDMLIPEGHEAGKWGHAGITGLRPG